MKNRALWILPVILLILAAGYAWGYYWGYSSGVDDGKLIGFYDGWRARENVIVVPDGWDGTVSVTESRPDKYTARYEVVIGWDDSNGNSVFSEDIYTNRYEELGGGLVALYSYWQCNNTENILSNFIKAGDFKWYLIQGNIMFSVYDSTKGGVTVTVIYDRILEKVVLKSSRNGCIIVLDHPDDDNKVPDMSDGSDSSNWTPSLKMMAPDNNMDFWHKNK